MSDFDEEAEREKLRERFAEEDEKRETTERMSELLLQGATMTDTHCDTCGNPLFRYEGQTFCATCQRTEDDGGTAETTTESGSTAPEARTADQPTADEPATNTPDDGQHIAVDDPRDPADRDGAGTTRRTTAPEGGRSDSTHGRRAPPSQTAETGSESRQRTRSGGAGRADETTAGLAETEASLSRTLHRLAGRAEGTDDLGRAREHLAAVREAAEALDAVRDARR